MPDEQYVTMREAREILGVSNYTIWKMAREGRIDTWQSQIDRRQKLIRVSDLEKIKTIRTKTTPEPRKPGSE